MQPDLLNVEHIPQDTEAGCLLACVQMVTRYLGNEVSQAESAALLEAMPEGVPASRIRRLDSRGFKVTYQQDANLATLRDWLIRKLPPIAFIQTGALEYWDRNTDHALVMVGMSDDRVWVNDPAFPDAPQVCSLNAFLLAWGEFENRFAVMQKG